MFVVNKTNQGTVSLPASEISPEQAKVVSSGLAQRILREIASKPAYAMAISKKLRVNEQKIYYHIRKLEQAKIIEVSHVESTQGAKTTYYKLKQPAFVIKFKEFKRAAIGGVDIGSKDFLEPFIEDGQLNANIIVGSPDPHGPQKARSRDGYYGIDLALFLGTYLHFVPELKVKLDTEAREEDLRNNLIIIGGPVVNSVTDKINDKLPIRFDKKDNYSVYSNLSKKHYYSDEIGIIVKVKNPFNPKKQIMLVAGKRYSGTRAVMIAFMKEFSSIIKGNKFDSKVSAKIVEGIDLNSDGTVDAVEFLE